MIASEDHLRPADYKIPIGLLLCLVIRSLIAPLYLIASVALSFFAPSGSP
jgi:uncharacterized membrane protein YdfJ with MMPL/SSD domain